MKRSEVLRELLYAYYFMHGKRASRTVTEKAKRMIAEYEKEENRPMPELMPSPFMRTTPYQLHVKGPAPDTFSEDIVEITKLYRELCRDYPALRRKALHIIYSPHTSADLRKLLKGLLDKQKEGSV